MKRLVEYFKAQGVLFETLEPLDIKAFGIKKRWRFFEGVDLKKNYWLIVEIERKSRFLHKDAKELDEIAQRVENNIGHLFRRRFLYLRAPLCSKAKGYLQDVGWRVDATL